MSSLLTLSVFSTCVLLALLPVAFGQRAYVGIKATVVPMYSIFHTGDKIKVRCYAAGDTVTPSVYFTWNHRPGYSDALRLSTGNPPGVVVRSWPMDMPNTMVAEITLDRTFYLHMTTGDNLFECHAYSIDGHDPVRFTVEKV